MGFSSVIARWKWTISANNLLFSPLLLTGASITWLDHYFKNSHARKDNSTIFIKVFPLRPNWQGVCVETNSNCWQDVWQVISIGIELPSRTLKHHLESHQTPSRILKHHIFYLFLVNSYKEQRKKKSWTPLKSILFNP